MHCRYGASKAQPWRGRSPLALAASTSRVAAALEHALDSELGFQLSQMIAPKARSEYGIESSISPENLGKIVESFSKHVQSSSFILPSDVSVTRLGPSPPDALGELRDKLSDSVLVRRRNSPSPAVLGRSGDRFKRGLQTAFARDYSTLGNVDRRGIKREVGPGLLVVI